MHAPKVALLTNTCQPPRRRFLLKSSCDRRTHSVTEGTHGSSRCSCPPGRQTTIHRDSTPRRPARGRGADRNEGDGHLPHRRVHLVGRRPGGDLSVGPRARRGRCGRRSRAGRELIEARKSRHSALCSGVPQLRVLHLGENQSVSSRAGNTGARAHARREQPLFDRQRDDLSLHGHVDVRPVHGRSGDRSRKNS